METDPLNETKWSALCATLLGAGTVEKYIPKVTGGSATPLAATYQKTLFNVTHAANAS